MSMLKKDGTSIYDHMNETDKVTVSIDMDELARKLVSMNYGVVRLFAALIRVRKAEFAERMAEYRKKDSSWAEIADRLEPKGDAIVNALRELLINDEF